MALHSWEFGNPEDVAARKEAHAQRQEAACGACVHRRTMDWQGETWNYCEYKRRVYGRRCDLFEIIKTKGTT